MNIQYDSNILNKPNFCLDAFITGVKRMNYQVFYFTRWLKKIRFCGEFNSLESANRHVDYLQNKLPNGNKIIFEITR